MNIARPVVIGLVAVALMGCASTASQSPATSAAVTTAATESVVATTTTSTEAAITSAGSSTFSFALPHNAAELEALLPDKIGTATLTKLSWSGQDFVNANTGSPELKTWLESLGKSLSDVSAAAAFDVTGGTSIFAFRVNGVDHTTLFTAFQQAAIKSGETPTPYTNQTVGGKQVAVAPANGTGESNYVYGVADLIFIVSTKDPATAAEALSKLP
jgi:hypothetical protein